MNDLTDFQRMSEEAFALGECPLWNEAEGMLYWIDWLGNRLYRTTGPGKPIEHRDLGRQCGSFAFCKSGRILLARYGDLALLDWKSGRIESLLEVPPLDGEEHVNDGKCDPAGRFWFGMISKVQKRGRLFCFDPTGGVLRVVRDDVATSNGLGWSPQGDAFYYADSGHWKLWKADFEAVSGSVRNWRVIAQREIWGRGDPDGLCVDAEGYLWVAVWDGFALVRLSPEGEIVQRIDLPIARPTSCSFGGVGLRRLMVTSASVGLEERERSEASLASGNVFSFKPTVSGSPIALCSL